MIYNIGLINDAYGTVDKEFIVSMELDLTSDLGKWKLEEFRKFIVDDKLMPDEAVQKAFVPVDPTAKLIVIDKAISIFY